jgi:hypothetical protein
MALADYMPAGIAAVIVALLIVVVWYYWRRPQVAALPVAAANEPPADPAKNDPAPTDPDQSAELQGEPTMTLYADIDGLDVDAINRSYVFDAPVVIPRLTYMTGPSS